MALDMNANEGTGELVEVDTKMWLTAGRERLVPDGHTDAAFLYCTPGMQVPRAEAERYGLLGDTEGKAQPAPPNKARRANQKRSPDGDR